LVNVFSEFLYILDGYEKVLVTTSGTLWVAGFRFCTWTTSQDLLLPSFMSDPSEAKHSVIEYDLQKKEDYVSDPVKLLILLMNHLSPTFLQPG